MTTTQIRVGDTVEILPAYSMDTSSRSIWDDIAGCAAVVTNVRGSYADVDIKNGPSDENVHIARLVQIARW